MTNTDNQIVVMDPIPEKKYTKILNYLGQNAVDKMVKEKLTEYKSYWEAEDREVVLTATRGAETVFVTLECMTQTKSREFQVA